MIGSALHEKAWCRQALVHTSASFVELLINSLCDTDLLDRFIFEPCTDGGGMGIPDDFHNFIRWLRGEPVVYDYRLGKYVGTHSLEASSPQPGATPPDPNRLAERLDYVNRLFADNRISQDEAATARAAILKDLT
jgi:hypothetical protein